MTSGDVPLRIGSVRKETEGGLHGEGAAQGPLGGSSLGLALCGPAGPGEQGLSLFSRVASCFVYEGIWAKTKITITESGLVLGQ